MQLYYRFLLISCLLGATFGMQLLGANRCTWGPSWWCVNETTANDCGATQHCIDNVWNSQTAKKQQSKAMEDFLKNPLGLLPVGIMSQPEHSVSLTQDACDVCKDRVLEIKILIKDNATSEGFEKLLISECVKWFNNEDSCYEIISHSSDAIFSIIKRSSPEQVCDLVLQCGNICSECKTGVVVVENALSQNLTDQEILYLFLEFCAKLGPYSGACKTAVTSKTDLVIDDLINFLQNDPCSSLGACDSSLQQVTSDTECTLCLFIWEYVVHEISLNSTEEEIKSMLKDICQYLGKLKDLCVNFVDANVGNIIEYILDNQSPHKFCTEVKACNSSSTFALSPLPKQTPSALVCSALASIFQSLFSTDLIVRSVVQVFYMTCNMLPDETAVENCQSFVMLYVAGILQIINAALPVSYLCIAFLGNNPNTISDVYDNSLAFNPAVQGVLECHICELVLEIVRIDIDSSKSVKDIQNDVNMTCQWFSEGTLRRDCESAVLLVPVVLDLLAHNIVPEEICYVVTACPKNSTIETKTVAKHNSQDVSFDVTCFACKAGVQLTFSFLASNHTQQEMISIINGLCTIVSPNYGCEGFLQDLLPPLMDYLEQQFSAEEVCIGIGMCQNDEVGGYTVDKNAPIEETEDIGCLVCSALATLLDDYTESYSENTIISIASDLCNQFGDFSDECKSIVANELPNIIEKLRAGVSPQQLCAEVRLCQAVTSRVSASLLKGMADEDEDQCDTCLDAIDSIRIMLANEGEDYTKEYLIEQCIAAYSKIICKQAISRLIKIIQSGEDPSDICTQLNLCSLKPGLGSYIDCDTCEKYGKEIEGRVTDDTSLSDFKQILFNVCSENGNKMICKMFVSQYSEQLYNLVITQGQSYEQICKEIDACSVSTTSLEVSSNTRYCAECKFIIMITKQAISKTSEDEIEKNLDTLCNLLGEDQYEKCKDLLDSFIGKLYDVLNGDMSVTELCEEINACSSEQVTLQKTYLQLWEELQQSPSTDCVLCTWISQSIHPQLIELYSQESLKYKLASKCSKLPLHNHASCEEFVENNYFISTLKSDSNSPVCQTINICQGKYRSPAGFSLFI